MTIIYEDVEGSGEVHLDVLKAISGNTQGKSMVDICCGFAPQTRQLGFEERFFIDIVKRDLAEENINFFVSDVFHYAEGMADFEVAFDAIFCLDAIEHFEKDKSMHLLSLMDKIANKQIIFTPLGDYLIETTPTNNPDSHKSGWEPKEFEDMGYATIVFKKYHPTLNIGAFFAIKCDNLEDEFIRIGNELKNKSWIK
jgi:hypothetical protein